jgi:hypothetical protein
MAPQREEAALSADRDTPSAAEGYFPVELSLGRAHPNPGRGGASIDLAVPEDRLGDYTLKVFDVRGGKVFETVERIGQAGVFVLEWRGRDGSGSEVGSGIYFLKIEGPGGLRETQKVVLLR